jgi:hypothetical protein
MPHLGHSCHGIAALIAVSLATASCMTMTPHSLGPVADPATERQMDKLAAQGETFAEIQKPVGALDPRLGVYRVLGSEPGLLMLEAKKEAVPVPLVQILSMRKFNHPRGAYESAVRVGALGFFAGLLTGTAVSLLPRSTDGSAQPNPATNGLAYGLVAGLAGAALGAAVGGLVGHEDRYWPIPP